MNFKSIQSKNAFLLYRKYYSVVLLMLICGIPTQLLATDKVQKPTEVTQQKKTVKGIVLDENNETLIGVTVLEKGTTNGIITDVNGKFELNVSNANAKLIFSYIGYDTKELIVENTELTIQLIPAIKQIDEVVIVGYASQKKQSVVGSIAQTTGDVLKTRGGVTDMSNALSGAIPGVIILTPAGNPGGGVGSDPLILIRGMNTWNDASPLILVDGVERKMNDIDMNEVASVSVLKDASATAVFGVRGANGVILITTKQGNTGKPKVNIELNTAFKSYSKIEKQLDSYDALLARNYALVNELPLPMPQANWNTYYIPDRILGYFKDQSNPLEYPNVDWRAYMMRPYTKTDKYAVNISGGTDFVKYFTSVSYTSDGDILNSAPNPKGYTPEFNYKRYNFRTNLDFNLTKTTQFKVNLSGYYGKQQEPGIGISAIAAGIYRHSPTAIPIYPDGIFGSDEETSDKYGTNVYSLMQTTGTKSTGRTSLTSDFEITQKLDFITKGLTAKAKYSYDNYFATKGVDIVDNEVSTTKRYDIPSNSWVITKPTIGSNGFDVFPTPLGYNAETTAAGTQSRVYYDVSLNYNRKFGKNNIGALALFSRQEAVTGTNWPVKREDWVARVTYNYDERYLAEVNGAYNGSDQFGPGHKFSLFPSLALGWRISEEKFIKENIPQISNLKLKYSVGLVGNDNLRNIQWGYLTTWGNFSGNFQKFGYPNFGYSPYYSDPSKTPSPVYVEGTPGNPNLQWEMARKQNIGAELGLFDGLFTGSADFFNEHRWNVLMVGSTITAYPAYVGAVASPSNLGIINSRGLELEFKLEKKIRKVNLWASYNWTQAINNVVSKADPQLAPAYQKQAGFPINQNNTLLTAGIIQSWDQMYTVAGYDGAIGQNKNGIPGDIYLVDFNSNGVTDKYDSAPNGYSSYPQNTYGFSLGGDYAGFSIMVQFYGAYNVTLMEGMLYEFINNSPTISQIILDKTFQPEYQNANPDYPSLSIKRTSLKGNNVLGYGSSLNYDASYLRLKTAELSYTVPKKFSEKFSIDNMRFYVNGNNLLFWSKLAVDIEGVDPNTGAYPNSKNINLGLRVTF
ncbi:MAG: TonB-dependent receptor [Bacteroidia bacterium]|nr:TonB-dependent receptor [Bacteroidia bacterium]